MIIITEVKIGKYCNSECDAANFSSFFFFWPWHMAYWILAPPLGTNPMPLALEAQNLNHRFLILSPTSCLQEAPPSVSVDSWFYGQALEVVHMG